MILFLSHVQRCTATVIPLVQPMDRQADITSPKRHLHLNLAWPRHGLAYHAAQWGMIERLFAILGVLSRSGWAAHVVHHVASLLAQAPLCFSLVDVEERLAFFGIRVGGVGS